MVCPSRIERVVGYNISFTVFDEASVAEWKGQNLKVARKIPNIDVLVLVVERGRVEDISDVLDSECGLVHYVSSFWRGFYPLLLIELDESVEDSPEEENEEYNEKLEQLMGIFGDVHHVRMSRLMVERKVDWLHKCLAKLYVHSRVFQCSRFFGTKVNKMDKCPGGCDLCKFAANKDDRCAAVGGTRRTRTSKTRRQTIRFHPSVSSVKHSSR